MKTDDFGDRMKSYEIRETERRLMNLCPVIARMDGISFHSFCKDLEKPFDSRLSGLMIAVSRFLLHHFGADVAYTQSDEITLGWANLDSYTSELYCGGKIQKLNSHLASKTSVRFNKMLPQWLPEKVDTDAYFDARVFSVPNLIEAANEILWREQDAAKNSISMAARSKFSHAKLMNKNGSEMQEMLFQKHGINWNDYPNAFKRGTFLLKRTLETPFSAEELSSLPPEHAARNNPELVIKRSRIVRYGDLPKFSTVTNRVEFLFCGAEPIYGQI